MTWWMNDDDDMKLRDSWNILYIWCILYTSVYGSCVVRCLLLLLVWCGPSFDRLQKPAHVPPSRLLLDGSWSRITIMTKGGKVGCYPSINTLEYNWNSRFIYSPAFFDPRASGSLIVKVRGKAGFILCVMLRHMEGHTLHNQNERTNGNAIRDAHTH